MKCIQHTPCFGIYKLRCNILGGKLVSVPMVYKKEKRKLRTTRTAILKAITDKTKIIVIANPNNPTGNFMDAKDFVRIAETGIPFIVDEAYVEYAGLKMSQVQLTKKYKNVLVTRTLSKAYGLAGLRFGYALGDKDVIGQISAALLPWNVGTIAMWAGMAALEDTEGLEMRVKFNNSEVDFIEESLSDIPGSGDLPLSRQLHPLRLRRDRQDGRRRAQVRPGARHHPARRSCQVRQRWLVPRDDRLQGREPHGCEADPRVPDQLRK